MWTLQRPDQTVLDAYLRLDEEILKLEEQCPGPRLITIEAWIKYLESKESVSTNDIIQLPLHMLDEEFDEEQELTKYSRRTRLENDCESLAKVRQVCIWLFCCLLYVAWIQSCNKNNNNNQIVTKYNNPKHPITNVVMNESLEFLKLNI